MDLTVKPDPDRKVRERGAIQTLQAPMATIHDDDELLLARIGYKQVFTGVMINCGATSDNDLD
jgi:hypothetical protein